MAEDKSIRVVVKVSPSRHPELFDALNDIESSGRAERLRSLALMALSGYTAANDSPDPSPGKPKRNRNKPVPPGDSAIEKPSPEKPEVAQASNDGEDGEKPEAAPEPDAVPEEEEKEDPHAHVRASVVSGLKNSGF